MSACLCVCVEHVLISSGGEWAMCDIGRLDANCARVYVYVCMCVTVATSLACAEVFA